MTFLVVLGVISFDEIPAIDPVDCAWLLSVMVLFNFTAIKRSRPTLKYFYKDLKNVKDMPR